MNKEQIISIFDSFNDMNVMIVGDVMIDAYYSGKVDRISPEAPVPVIHVTSSEKRLGGAANVARNIKSLGANPILCSAIGNDFLAEELKDLMTSENMRTDGIISFDGRKTTLKTRIISGSQQMMRIDEEEISNLSTNQSETFLNKLEQIISENKIDVILFEDYDKGLLEPGLIKAIVKMANVLNIPTCVDPKKKNFLSYKNVSLFKPNKKELEEGLKLHVDFSDLNELKKAHASLNETLKHRISLITLSEHGVFVANEENAEIIPAHIRNISDVSGAGDTVISVAALCLAANANAREIAQISNLAGGLVCEKVGVVPVDKGQLLRESLNIGQE